MNFQHMPQPGRQMAKPAEIGSADWLATSLPSPAVLQRQVATTNQVFFRSVSDHLPVVVEMSVGGSDDN